MSDDGNLGFAELMARVRSGDELAVQALVGQFEPEIRREVRSRLRLRDSRLRRVFDSMDIVQSVFQSFFFHAAAGQYDLASPERLCRLLAVMARNKLAEQVRYLHRERRDNRRTESRPDDDPTPIEVRPSPSQVIANRELLDELSRRLSEHERRLVELRVEGRSWAEVASVVGGSAEACRKQFSRAVDRVSLELGLLESGWKAM